MLTVADFSAWQHTVQVQGLVHFNKTMARVRFKMVYTQELEVDGCEGGLIIYHGVILKEELGLMKGSIQCR
jgi:hypothetical protein